MRVYLAMDRGTYIRPWLKERESLKVYLAAGSGVAPTYVLPWLKERESMRIHLATCKGFDWYGQMIWPHTHTHKQSFR